MTRVKYRGLSLPSRTLHGHTVAGSEIAVETDYLPHYVLFNLCNFSAVVLCRMHEEGNWGNRNMLCYVMFNGPCIILIVE